MRTVLLGAALFVFFFRLAEILSIISRVSPTVVVNYIRVLPTVFVNYINCITLLSQFYVEPLIEIGISEWGYNKKTETDFSASVFCAGNWTIVNNHNHKYGFN